MKRPVKLYEDKKGRFYIINKKGKKLYLKTKLSFKELQQDIIRFYKETKTKIKKKKYKKRLYRKKPITQKELTEEQRRLDTQSSSGISTQQQQQPTAIDSSKSAPIRDSDIYLTDIQKQEPFIMKIRQLEQALITNTDTSGNIDKDFKDTITRQITDLSDKSKIGEKVIKDMITKQYNKDINRQERTIGQKKYNIRSDKLGRKLTLPLDKSYNLEDWKKLPTWKRQYLNKKWKQEIDNIGYEETKSEGSNKEEKNATYDRIREERLKRQESDTTFMSRRTSLDSVIANDEQERLLSQQDITPMGIEGVDYIVVRPEDRVHYDEYGRSIPLIDYLNSLEVGIMENDNRSNMSGQGINNLLKDFSFLPILHANQIQEIPIKQEEPTYFIVKKNNEYTAVFIDSNDCCIYDPLGENDKEIKEEVLDLCLKNNHNMLRKIKYNTKPNENCWDTGFCCIQFIEKMLDGQSFKNSTKYEGETQKSREQYV